MTTIPFGAQLIGRTEKALNAILDRSLAGRGLTEPQWVALTLTVTADGADPAVRLAQALRIAEPVARERLAELAAAGLVRPAAAGGAAEPTERGQELWREVSAELAGVTGELWGDLPEGDREAAARVLRTVLSRADAFLA
ncbi:hypothetical protein [Paractinoplanes maris]|uniref:hypothetical protein n=1 Tax=Paractinoplanes maris TaxID=1734446 RepID=UPI00202204FE|nr:hypothetical protein [Actinoplanes maris]